MKTLNYKNKFFDYFKIKLTDLHAMMILCLLSFVFTIIQTSGSWKGGSGIEGFRALDAQPMHAEPVNLNENAKPLAFHSFNPNHVDQVTLEQMGVPSKTARIFIHYRTKIGSFRKKEELKKIYGMTDELYDSLLPYIEMREPGQNVSSKRTGIRQESNWTIDINTADAEAFERLYGIGPFLAKRIVNFREKLGGFYSIDQVGETYGIADSIFQKCKEHLVMGKVELHQINVNQASFQELDAHPYIPKKLAEEMIKLREKLGKIEEIESLHSLRNWDKHPFEKVKPYLKLSD